VTVLSMSLFPPSGPEANSNELLRLSGRLFYGRESLFQIVFARLLYISRTSAAPL
jgi:hypothetical protein